MEQQLPQLNQEKLKTLDQLSSFDLAKSIFWKHANRVANRELKANFELDEHNKQIVSAFVAYFTGDLNTMEQHQIDPRKGIILIGNPGSGKSILFRIMRECLSSTKIVALQGREMQERHLFRKFNFYTCEHMAKLFMDKGELGLVPFSKNAVVEINNEMHCKHACFDDLGAEEKRVLFGNVKEVMVDIIQERYDHFLNHGLHTHFTTNLSPEEIESRYSSRVRGRLKQMCNVLALGANKEYKDRR